MNRQRAALDEFRLLAAALVIAIHTSPLVSFTEAGNFWLTRVLGRVAVPFFLMASGYFLARQEWKGIRRFCRKLLLLYGAAVLLYLPLNWYSGSFPGWPWFRGLLLEGTFYHLWYFPAAVLGGLIARQLLRLGWPAACAAAGALYLLGLGGDSWFGLAERVPLLQTLYRYIFSVFRYTRNGLFYAPLFFVLGAAELRLPRRAAAAAGAAALLAMSVEAFWLRGLGVQRHDSVYLFLPPLMICLFSLLLGANHGERRELRTVSLLVYLLHPLVIVFVRGAAKLTGLQSLLVENSLTHYAAVLAGSMAVSWALLRLWNGKAHAWTARFCERFSPPRADLRAWREINLDALRHNVAAIQAALPAGCLLMGVVKADAYGHGAVPCARAMQSLGVRSFAVACLTEGIALRRAGIRGEILILGYTGAREVPLLRRWQLTQMVADAEHGQALAAAGGPVRIHLGIDTGMHRLGIPAGDYAAMEALYRCKNLRVEGVFSHLCVVDSLAPGDVAYTGEQLSRFYETVEWLRAHGYPTGKVHIQASYGLLNLSGQRCDLARIGIALYGVRSSDAPVRYPLEGEPVLSLRARVTSVRTLAAGECAGYDRAFQAERPTRLAAVSIGYADGLPRELPSRGGQVLIRGRRCPLIGRLCMDQALADVTALPEAAAGDLVTLIGSDGGESIRAEEVAAQCGTITNELLSRLGPRLPLAIRQIP